MISVIIATYNGEKYINQQIESVLSQNTPVDEIIICDDNSKDNTIFVARSILQKWDAHYKIIQHNENKGVVQSFYDAFNISENEYVFFSDQDDVWLPNKTEEFMAAFNKFDCDLVFSDAELTDAFLNPMGTTLLETKSRIKIANGVSQIDTYELSRVLPYGNMVTGMSMAAKREFVLKCCPFPNEMLHDNWIALNACAKGTMVSINMPLAYYRQHENNVIGAKKGGFFKKLNHSLETGENGIKKELSYADCIKNIYTSATNNVSIDSANEYCDFVEKRFDYHERKIGIVELFRLYKCGLYRKFYTNRGFEFLIRDIIVL